MLVDRGHDPFDRGLAAVRAAALVDVRLELGAVLVDVAPHRPDGEVAERAQRPALDAIADVSQQIEVRMPGPVPLDVDTEDDYRRVLNGLQGAL